MFKMRNWATVLYITLTLVGCVNVKVHDCRPGVSAEKVQTCEFDWQHPTACLGAIWVKVNCPTE